jgi:hypothetical protein
MASVPVTAQRSAVIVRQVGAGSIVAHSSDTKLSQTEDAQFVAIGPSLQCVLTRLAAALP